MENWIALKLSTGDVYYISKKRYDEKIKKIKNTMQKPALINLTENVEANEKLYIPVELEGEKVVLAECNHEIDISATVIAYPVDSKYVKMSREGEIKRAYL